jgi:hypothetical protein
MHLDWTNMLVLNANIATDIFFLLSGIALAYTELSKKRVSNFYFYSVKLWIRRYIRCIYSLANWPLPLVTFNSCTRSHCPPAAALSKNQRT